MTGKSDKNENQVSIRTGNISNTSGEINIAGGNIEGTHTSSGLSAAEVGKLFDTIHAAIDGRANTQPVDKADLKAEVQEIQATVTEGVKKQQPVDEGFLARHFRNIARMAPDILDVLVATLANPLGGVGIAVKKIAEKAKEGTI